MTIPALLALPASPVQLSARARTGPSGRSRVLPCGPRLLGHGTTFGQIERLPCGGNCLAASYISLSVVYAYYEDS